MIQTRSIETIEKFSKMMKSIGKEWWFEYGTALGIIRQNDFIEGDKDIDIGVYADDKVGKMIGNLGQFAHSVSYWKVEGFNKHYRYIKFGKFDKFDILVYYKFDDYYSIRKEVDVNTFLCKRIPTKFLDKRQKIVFKGVDCYIPNNAHEYCEYLYGEDWRTPKDENNLVPAEVLTIESL